MRKKVFLAVFIVLLTGTISVGCGSRNDDAAETETTSSTETDTRQWNTGDGSKVYMTEDISADGLMQVYEALGVKNMYLGPTMPAFFSEPVARTLMDVYGLRPITSPEQDLDEILGRG